MTVPATRTDAGAAYVVFGSEDFDSLDLGALASRGFRLDGELAGEVFAPDDDAAGAFNFGTSVGGTGDLNGDGFVETLIGAPVRDVILGAAPLDRADAGTSYVVYGKDDSDRSR